MSFGRTYKDAPTFGRNFAESSALERKLHGRRRRQGCQPDSPMTFLDSPSYASAVADEAHGAEHPSLPRPEDVKSRELLGVPLAMTNYDEAMDVMDGMIARRERGYVCATAVHAVMVCQDDE
jgi:hypothetical protein